MQILQVFRPCASVGEQSEVPRIFLSQTHGTGPGSTLFPTFEGVILDQLFGGQQKGDAG